MCQLPNIFVPSTHSLRSIHNPQKGKRKLQTSQKSQPKVEGRNGRRAISRYRLYPEACKFYNCLAVKLFQVTPSLRRGRNFRGRTVTDGLLPIPKYWRERKISRLDTIGHAQTPTSRDQVQPSSSSDPCKRQAPTRHIHLVDERRCVSV